MVMSLSGLSRPVPNMDRYTVGSTNKSVVTDLSHWLSESPFEMPMMPSWPQMLPFGSFARPTVLVMSKKVCRKTPAFRSESSMTVLPEPPGPSRWVRRQHLGVPDIVIHCWSRPSPGVSEVLNCFGLKYDSVFFNDAEVSVALVGLIFCEME
jgi:hypothetical protein